MSAFVEWFNSYKGKYIYVEIAGEIFGGRYGESPQLVREYAIEEPNVYKLYFGTSEILVITNPTSFLIGQNTELLINKAEQAVFGWHYYGRSQIPENWCTETYDLKENGYVEYNCNGPISSYLTPHKTFNLGDRIFLRLLA